MYLQSLPTSHQTFQKIPFDKMMPGRISFLATLLAFGNFLVNDLLANLFSLLLYFVVRMFNAFRSVEYKVIHVTAVNSILSIHRTLLC